MIATYSIQQWLFADAPGRYDIDLAESGVQFQRLKDLHLDPEWELDYSLDRGIAALRSGVADLYGRPVHDDHAVITHGAQEALYLLYRCALAPGDHVVTTSPGWQQSWEVPAHIGCEVSVLPTRPGPPFDAEALARLITPRTKLLVLNSPGNPSGYCFSERDWSVILDVARAHDLIVVNDEEYLLDFAESIVHRYPKALSVSGLSKVYGLPALRIGWAFGMPEVIARMVNYKRYTTVSNSWVWERVAVDVLHERDRHIRRYREFVDGGIDRLRAFADEYADRLRLVPPANTPYAWFDLHASISSQVLAERLLDEQRVLVMPAEVFGSAAGLRISYARPAAVLDEGLSRLGKLIAQLD
ncbi:pyridoxal phosphate-dependent aminotransferase [Nocardia sp. CDC159]|uniref:Aminotransferase n=1 Tax=Nocardia pulmonis TaxID=2951408 RepID=A0A9X2E612_9NOCA|nr:MULTISPECIES: pyridoxal phosphate-dependent aminotransferase [Nocardia]MCM6774321.1 pyridoxal phosphate-dependent aminotransferase [Nocardia pulmonis]MCM6787613.1 pyridoxal phosphate-dependent aminotransferase [Nocardia sp. CDC159]